MHSELFGFVIQKCLLHRSAATNRCVLSSRREGDGDVASEGQREKISFVDGSCSLSLRRSCAASILLRRLALTVSLLSLPTVSPPPNSPPLIHLSLPILSLLSCLAGRSTSCQSICISSFVTTGLQTETPADLTTAQSRCAGTCQFGL